jgi:hypothetical protein
LNKAGKKELELKTTLLTNQQSVPRLLHQDCTDVPSRAYVPCSKKQKQMGKVKLITNSLNEVKRGPKKYWHLIKKTGWKRFEPVKVLTFKHCCSGSNVRRGEAGPRDRLAKTVQPVKILPSVPVRVGTRPRRKMSLFPEYRVWDRNAQIYLIQSILKIIIYFIMIYFIIK